MAEQLEQMVANNLDLLSIPASGSIAKKIIEIVKTGDCNEHRRLQQEIPQSLLELLKIRNGPKKVGLVYRQLGIETMTSFRWQPARSAFATCRNGPEDGRKILKGIEDLRKTAGAA